MKKLDIGIIIFVLIIGVLLFSFYYNKLVVDVTKSKLNIYYQDILIDSINIHENINKKYTIYSEDKNKLIVEIHENNNIIDTKEFTVSLRRDIVNKVIVSFEEIRMSEANCPNKDCLKMIMSVNRHITFPIVCTNGIIVQFQQQTPSIPDPIS